MAEPEKETATREDSCTRSGIDRRQFSYSYHIPERRSGKDRRKGFDRRAGLLRRRRRDRRFNDKA